MKGMKRRLRSFGRSIRHKVLLGIVLSLVGVGTLGTVSYYYLRQLEETLALAEGVDDLQSDVLEIRRSEKNYLLYGLGADREESLRYVDQAISRARGLLHRKPGADLPRRHSGLRPGAADRAARPDGGLPRRFSGARLSP